MRKWTGKLHGGQLVILVVPLMFASYVLGVLGFLGGYWIVAGIGIASAALAFAMVWWWFGARREK